MNVMGIGRCRQGRSGIRLLGLLLLRIFKVVEDFSGTGSWMLGSLGVKLDGRNYGVGRGGVWIRCLFGR